MPAPAPTPVDWWSLELAFGHIVPGHHAFFDRSTGEVITIQDELPEAPALRLRVASEADRYLPIDPVSSRDQHRWMVRFIGTQGDPELRARLTAAVTQSGAFRNFKDLLQTVPAVRDRWFAYRKDMLRVHIERWFADHDLEAGPAEPRASPTLRQTAHTLLEHLPAADLPAVVAFLMHLGTRPRR